MRPSERPFHRSRFLVISLRTLVNDCTLLHFHCSLALLFPFIFIFILNSKSVWIGPLRCSNKIHFFFLLAECQCLRPRGVCTINFTFLSAQLLSNNVHHSEKWSLHNGGNCTILTIYQKKNTKQKQKKFSGAHSRVATLIQPSFQKKQNVYSGVHPRGVYTITAKFSI